MSNHKILVPVESHARVEGWIKTSNFDSDDTVISEYNMPLKPSAGNTMKIADNNNNNAATSNSVGKLKESHCKKTILNQTVPNETEVSTEANKTTGISTVNSYESVESMTKLMETLKSSSNIKGVSKTGALSTSWELYQGRTKSKSEPPDQFSTIIEAEESVRVLISVTFLFLLLIVILPAFCFDILTFCLFSPF